MTCVFGLLVVGQGLDGAVEVVVAGAGVVAGGVQAGVAHELGDGDDVDAPAETGKERCSNPVECLSGVGACGWSLVVVGDEFGGVLVPVGSGLMLPSDGGGGGEVEQCRLGRRRGDGRRGGRGRSGVRLERGCRGGVGALRGRTH